MTPEQEDTEAFALIASRTQQAADSWRLLTRADTIQKGDEALCDDCMTWRPLGPGVFVGCPYNPGFFLPIRRRVTA